MTPSAGLERQEDELQSLCTLMQDSLRQHEDDLSQARRTYEAKLNDARRNDATERRTAEQQFPRKQTNCNDDHCIQKRAR